VISGDGGDGALEETYEFDETEEAGQAGETLATLATTGMSPKSVIGSLVLNGFVFVFFPSFWLLQSRRKTTTYDPGSGYAQR
jgi:hypothetical protein